MSIARTDMPPFSALLAFEAVVRLGSFTAAAREFGVSQAAVSQKVREFEGWLGVKVIAQTRPALVVTEAGLGLADTIRAGVSTMVQALDRAKPTRGNPNRVTLASTNAFAVYWLSSRIDTFYARHPNIELSLSTSDPEITSAALKFDLGVVYAPEPPDGYVATLLFNTDVVAIASPRYLKGRPDGIGPGQWLHDTLLHLTPDPWMAWQDWLPAVGLPPADRLRAAHHSTFITLIHAVTAGQGIGLGWRRLIDPLLKNGDVVKVGPYEAEPKGAYYLIEAPDRSPPRPPAIRILKDWILSQIKQDD